MHKLQNGFDPIADYINLFESKRKDLLGFEHFMLTGDPHQHSVLLTWRVSMDKLENEPEGELATQILKTAAYLDPDFIFVNELRVLFTRDYEDYCQNNKFDDAILLISKYTLAFINSGTMTVHRLLQEVLRFEHSENETEESFIGQLLICMGSHSLELFSVVAWAIWNHALKYDGLVREYWRIGLEISKGFSREEVKAVMDRFEALLPEVHEAVLEIKLHYGEKLLEADRLEEALTLVQRLYTLLVSDDSKKHAPFAKRSFKLLVDTLERSELFEAELKILREGWKVRHFPTAEFNLLRVKMAECLWNLGVLEDGKIRNREFLEESMRIYSELYLLARCDLEVGGHFVDSLKTRFLRKARNQNFNFIRHSWRHGKSFRNGQCLVWNYCRH